MGSWAFTTYRAGADCAAAFRAAHADAVYEHGHGGSSGTIAEKTAYVIITRTIMTLAEASAHASTLIGQRDSRIVDKWGPAGAIPVKQPTPPTTAGGDVPEPVPGHSDRPTAGQQAPDGWLFFGWADS